MASKDLKKLANRILDDLAKTADTEQKSARASLEKQVGQILIINRTRFSKLLTDLVPRLRGPSNQSLRDTVWNNYHARLKKLEARIPPERLKELKGTKIGGLRANDYVFYVRTYATAKRAKSSILRSIIEKVVTDLSEAEKDKLSLLGGKNNKQGAQLGHEEAGQGIPTSGVRVARAKKIASGSGEVSIQNALTRYENTLGLEIKHEQIIDANLGIKKKYVPIISWQRAIDNNTQAQLERAALESLTKELQDIANLQSSTSLKDGVSQVLLEKAAPKAAKVKGKKKKKVKEYSRAKSTKKTVNKKRTRIVRDNSVDVSGGVPQGDGPSNLPLQLIGAFNRDLPNTLRKNMQSPRLQYRTGRFANSVKVVDVATTASGFLSFGYIYQKSPYQTFEPGFAQGSVDRDPRRLIDRSMREIASSYALGRFYTRRL